MTALFPLVLLRRDRLSLQARLRNDLMRQEFVGPISGDVMYKRLLATSALATVLIAGAAHAADLPTKAPIRKAPIAVPFSWTGFYIGGHVGYGWGDKEWSDFFDPVTINNNRVPGPDTRYHVNGFLGGGQVGFNWQSGWTVFGFEADGSWASIDGSGKGPASGGTC